MKVQCTDDVAVLGGRLLEDLAEVSSDLTVLDRNGMWAVVVPFSGPPLCARFRRSRSVGRLTGAWPGLASASAWSSSLDRPGFGARVSAVRESIAAGDVYQVNLCRRLSVAWPPDAEMAGLWSLLAVEHPSPHGALVHLPSVGVHVASASPERFLRRDGALVESRPIKGTATRALRLLPKDRAENVMIVDLVRNDLGRVCEYGSVTVAGLCEPERHPGLVHLVSTVRGRLRAGTGWAELLEATFPPGSVTGAPKLAALHLIDRLEPTPRGVYCGAVGWIDADARRGDLSVAIRTFWLEDGRLCFGTGGAVTWDSNPEAEWAETELKARRLLQLVGTSWPGPSRSAPLGRPATEPALGNLASG